jgi:hypothetical protein
MHFISSELFSTHGDKFFSLTGFIAFSTMPELAHKIKMYFALAPIATVKYARSPGTKFLLLPDMMIKVCDTQAPLSAKKSSRPVSYNNALNGNHFLPEYLVMDIILPLLFTGIIWQTRVFIPD